MRAVASGVLAGVFASVFAALTVVADAQPAPDRERAKVLYQAAEAAMREARYEDAIRDYGAAYELARDPAFLYKLGSANDRAGKCEVAVTFYRRYLRDGKPKEDFAKLTRARIAACGADPDAPLEPEPAAGGAAPPPGSGGAAPAPGPGGAPPPDAGAAPKPGPGGAAQGAVTVTPPAKPDAAAPAKPDAAAPAKPDAAGPAKPDAAAPAKPDAAGPAKPGAAAPPPALRGRHNGPWLLVGGSLALVTVGSVLAYSANAAERDVEDLYVGLNGTSPPFNSTTRRLYDDAIAEGRRYQTLSIVSFSLAGAMALGAGLWFALDRGEQVTVTPAVAPGTAGVSTAIRF